MSFIIIYTTHPSKENAQKLANHLLQKKMVACANIFPIKSMYWYNGTIENEQEYVSIIKTTPENWEISQKEISEIHPYEVPCIIKIEVEANKEYEKWIYSMVHI
jgi:periplasmic divalent cation tolerance protein